MNTIGFTAKVNGEYLIAGQIGNSGAEHYGLLVLGTIEAAKLRAMELGRIQGGSEAEFEIRDFDYEGIRKTLQNSAGIWMDKETFLRFKEAASNAEHKDYGPLDTLPMTSRNFWISLSPARN